MGVGWGLKLEWAIALRAVYPKPRVRDRCRTPDLLDIQGLGVGSHGALTPTAGGRGGGGGNSVSLSQISPKPTKGREPARQGTGGTSTLRGNQRCACGSGLSLRLPRRAQAEHIFSPNNINAQLPIINKSNLLEKPPAGLARWPPTRWPLVGQGSPRFQAEPLFPGCGVSAARKVSSPSPPFFL